MGVMRHDPLQGNLAASFSAAGRAELLRRRQCGRKLRQPFLKFVYEVDAMLVEQTLSRSTTPPSFR